MGLPPSCFYPLQAFRSGGPAALAQVMENFFRSGWDPLVLGGVDGSNAHPNLAGGGLSWSGSSGSGGGGPYPPKPNPPPHLPAPWAKRLVVELADETADARIQKKGAPGTPDKKKPGIEFVIDPTDPTYGKVCFVAKQDLSKQIGSVIVENPVTVTNPKVEFVANYGKVRIGTTGAFDWELARNGTVTLDDNGTRIQFGRKMDFATGLGSITHIAGPTDQSFRLQPGTSRVLQILAHDGNLGLGVTTGGVLQIQSSDTTLTRLSAGVTKSGGTLGTNFGDHAVAGLLGYGAATGFRTKIDFGTPTADRTLTAPNRDLTLVGRAAAGTSNKIIRFDANGDAQDSGAEDDGTTISTARAVTITGATTTGDTRVVSVSLAYPTVDPGSGYTVTSAEGVVFVDASTLAGSDNFDVELPTASGSPNRRIAVKITSVGAGSSTITVKSAGGTVDGAAAATGVPMDATARSKVTYQSDGTNWWSV